jgi:hypothetical protein
MSANEPSTVTLQIDGSSGDAHLEHILAKVFEEYLALWKVKQRKYGPNNIAACGKEGVVIRLNDKVQRLRRFNFDGIVGDKEGSEEDAWLDALGYAAMGLIVYRQQWPHLNEGLSVDHVLYIINRFLEEQNV